MARVLSTVQECLSSSAEPNRVILARCFSLYDTFFNQGKLPEDTNDLIDKNTFPNDSEVSN